ncbi:flagellar basal body rod protein FlgG [Domibacillus epiphyticus]|uniref:Flagellar hook protein FlgE n=1 Tax=Domibacillus epiphyticus TaxID=1714355 RepID=A0A1V2ACB7_9BACI|nr:flagellar basal body rod protein FlgG [Domibacillus epiphyticus]OMP68607.1 flagellar basal body rod protein FlgG [Domibacillus epiphyticus]
MLRSMYSGISGLKNFQTKLDVVGNNISNVNTYGYKKGRTTFKDMVSQQISGATGASAAAGIGGTNPRQVGLGAQLAAIDTVHTQGSLQTTARTLDLALSGDGFFVLRNGNNDVYSRAGNFYLDEAGNLVNSDGLYVRGYGVASQPTATADATFNTTQGNINVPSTAKSLSIGSDGKVTYVDQNGNLRAAGQIIVAKFANPDGTEKVGSNTFEETTNSGVPTVGVPGAAGAGTIVSGTLEMSNVDLSEEFTEMIVAQRGFQANTRIITTSDEILQELMSMKR